MGPDFCGSGGHHGDGPRDCSFSANNCDGQNGESCYPLSDEQAGQRAFCLTPCEVGVTECGEGLECRAGDGDQAGTSYCLPFELSPDEALERCDVIHQPVVLTKCVPNKSRALWHVLKKAPGSLNVHMGVTVLHKGSVLVSRL